MKRRLLPAMLGLMGVHPNERQVALTAARVFEAPMLLLAGWIVIDWYLQMRQPEPGDYATSDWLIWGFFLVETTVLTLLVRNKLSYLKTNWVNLLIIVFSFPVLWDAFPEAAGFRVLRLVVLFSIFVQASRTLQQVLSRHHLGSTLVASFFVMVVAGTLMSIIDPNVKTPLDGIWWAWVTITTVGYGDLVPGSTAGRLFGSVLILMGIALFSMLTASFSAFFIEQEEEKISAQELKNSQQLEDLRLQVQALENKIDRLLDQRSD